MRLMSIKPLALAVLGGLLLAGCQANPPKRDPEFAVTLPPAPPPVQQHYTGAIYQAGHDLAYFEDLRARRVGDVLTIKLVERTDAKKSQTANVAKDTDLNVENPTVLGSPVQFGTPGFFPLASTTGNNLETRFGSSHGFTGEGDAAQRNELIGDITVTVSEVLPNGSLVVRGEKRVVINQGNEYVKISGIVRPVDIDTNNTVLSTKVADATIMYAGDGQVADAGRMGWLGRFFTGPWFPF